MNYDDSTRAQIAGNFSWDMTPNVYCRSFYLEEIEIATEDFSDNLGTRLVRKQENHHQLPPAKAGGLPVPSSAFKAESQGRASGLVDGSPSRTGHA